MTTPLTRETVTAMLARATEGPWRADGEPWNRIVWSSADNRVCFMAHSNGMDDDRDIATSDLVASAPELATALLAAWEGLDAVRADLDDALTFLDNAVSKAPEPLKALGSWLADMLDEDDWPVAERYLNGAVKSCAAQLDEISLWKQAKEAVERDVDHEYRRAERAEADITTYQEIVSTMTQEAEAAAAKLAERDAEIARLRDGVEVISWIDPEVIDVKGHLEFAVAAAKTLFNKGPTPTDGTGSK